MSGEEHGSDQQPNVSGRNSFSEAESDSSVDSNDDGSDSSYVSVNDNLSMSPIKSDENDNDGFEHVSTSEFTDGRELRHVIVALRDKQYNISEQVNLPVERKCQDYFEEDYKCKVVNNKVCMNYPKSIIVPVDLKRNTHKDERLPIFFESAKYYDRAAETTHARLKHRFAAPVILFGNKYICRSGTLTSRKTASFQQLTKSETSDAEKTAICSTISTAWKTATNMVNSVRTALLDNMKDLFKDDAWVLDYLKVKHVVDLMVEHRKIYNECINVSSCEMLHMDVYTGMKIHNLPFPGSEFFKLYTDANRNPEGLKFDWSASEVERELNVDANLKDLFPEIDVTEMKEWDLVQLTKNYLKMLLAILVKDDDGILIHGISGWDRTSLFTSLLRMSLWADGVIHSSLNSEEMAYLTVAYDWYLFGHQLPKRLTNRQEIMHFCFNFLPYIATDEFSITKMFKRLPADERKNREFPQYRPGREEALRNVSESVLALYQEHIIEHLPI